MNISRNNKRSSRREFLETTSALAAISVVPHMTGAVLQDRKQQDPSRQRFSKPADHFATGNKVAVTSTSKDATESALWALEQGGNAADAYIAASLTQTVVEHGLTSLGGGFSVKYFEAASKKIGNIGGLLGPAEAEPYDFERGSPVTQTGRAMVVPGFLAGALKAHQMFGEMEWSKLFEPAIKFASEGMRVSPLVIGAAGTKATRFPEGKAIWFKNGEMAKPGDLILQPELAKTLRGVAKDGPQSFYEGEFARHYVERAKLDDGLMTMKDLARWRELAKTRDVKLEGNYRGHQVTGGGLLIYALHLNEALDLKSFGTPKSDPDTVFRQYRIMEEVFHSTKDYSDETHEKYVSADFAREQADRVVNSAMRKMTFDSIFNTCFLIVRDRAGNVAWGTHSINTPSAFGAGIVVDGVYAAHAMNEKHVRGSGGSARGISTSFGMFKDGKPKLIAGSPGFGFVHGPWQFGSGLIEWDLSATDSMNLPRFGLPRRDGNVYFESHYDDSIFAMLADKGIPYYKGRPSSFTGIVGALAIDDAAEAALKVVQDGRRDGYARAE